ncbi:hypothetical protein HC891_17725 [Candidatus Gracilibacteria bacterium]|nr:hypothetical protein [Candidatus Gracilibacteria bacterium]
MTPRRTMLALLALFAMSLWVVPSAPVAAQELAAASNETEPNNSFETANNIGIGSQNSANAQVNSADDLDYFKFNAVAGQSYVIETFNVAKRSMQTAILCKLQFMIAISQRWVRIPVAVRKERVIRLVA